MRSFNRVVFCVVVLWLTSVRSPAAEEGFTSLFDGKTLNGWTINCLPKDRQQAKLDWTVDRGTILANTIGRKDHFYILLATDKEYGDFVLRVRFQVERGVTGNSGIQIRSRYNPETGWMQGPQIDIDPPNPQGTTGKLWNEGPGPHRWLSNEPIPGYKFLYADQGSGWNDLEITARGLRIRSVLNGVTVVDYDGAGVLDDEEHKKCGVGVKGVIGLQIHSNDELKLRFKDIRIKELHQATRDAARASGAELPIDLAIGGCGGVYFLAEPGDLTVEVEKRDRNRRGGRTELRAVLVGPDRKVLQDVSIPDDGLPPGKSLGPPQRVRLATRVPRKGVYALNVTVSQDRYGEAMVWGFRSNCPRYLIETSRGHRDERHQEPIVLARPDRPADVCFLPRRGAFQMEITNLPAGADALGVYDGRGTLVETLRPDAGGRASCAFPADPNRAEAPWRLHLPVQQATVHIDGVTRWDRDDPYPDLSFWTPDPKSYFPLPKYRWLLTPYSRLVYGRPGEQGEVAFRVHNNSDQKKSIRLQIEFPEASWPARLSAERVLLGAKESREVLVRYTVPAEGSRACHVRATPAEDPEFSTYCTLTVQAGTAPATRPLTMPLVLKAYRHENEQLGYLPDYPVENQVYFDLKNRPYAITASGLATCRDGKWAATELRSAGKSRDGAREGRALGAASAKIAFDRDGDLYVLATGGGSAVLMHSADGGKTFSAHRIPEREGRHGALDIEQFSGQNIPDGPPPILRYTQTAADPKRIWRRINDLELFLPKKVDGRISIGEPIVVSKQCIGLAAHSGIPSTVVSRGPKVHVVWAEATDPEVKVPGVPTYVVTCDRQTGTLGKPALVGYGPPPNDVHNTPSITMDSHGYLHVLAGTHGRPFPYAQSLKPNDAHSGWTDPVPAGEGLPQTYIGLVCGPDDTLHAVFRLWQQGQEPFPASHHATLAYQRKRPGKPWEPPRVLIVPPFSEYSVFYHRLTIDRSGRLFLSYDYWSTYWFYRTDHRGSRRALLMSPDGGDTWKLADTRDLRPGGD